MQGMMTPHEVELARDDNGATAGILQELADAVARMKDTPAIRFNKWHRIDFQHTASSIAEVDVIAAGLGATPKWNDEHTHYTAELEFSPHVTYVVVFITPEHMAAHNAHWAAFPREDSAQAEELAAAS